MVPLTLIATFWELLAPELIATPVVPMFETKESVRSIEASEVREEDPPVTPAVVVEEASSPSAAESASAFPVEPARARVTLLPDTELLSTLLDTEEFPSPSSMR